MSKISVNGCKPGHIKRYREPGSGRQRHVFRLGVVTERVTSQAEIFA